MVSAVPDSSDGDGGDAGVGPQADSDDPPLAQRIRARFAPLGGAELAVEPREPVRPVPDLGPGS